VGGPVGACGGSGDGSGKVVELVVELELPIGGGVPAMGPVVSKISGSGVVVRKSNCAADVEVWMSLCVCAVVDDACPEIVMSTSLNPEPQYSFHVFEPQGKLVGP